jgi:hypothetical protein
MFANAMELEEANGKSPDEIMECGHKSAFYDKGNFADDFVIL